MRRKFSSVKVAQPEKMAHDRDRNFCAERLSITAKDRPVAWAGGPVLERKPARYYRGTKL